MTCVEQTPSMVSGSEMRPGVLLLERSPHRTGKRIRMDPVLVESRARQLADQAVAQERDRIARDLHDTVAQTLFHTGMLLQSVQGRDGADDVLGEAIQAISEAMQELRSTIFPLRRPTASRSLATSVHRSVEEARRALRCPLEVDVDDDLDVAVAPELADPILAIVRESLTNVVKHACATRVQFGLLVRDGFVRVYLYDNGVGCAPTEVSGGYGLRNLRDRSLALDGNFELTSRVGSGTRLSIVIPLPVS